MGQMYSSSFYTVAQNQNNSQGSMRDKNQISSLPVQSDKTLDLSNEALIKLARSTGSQMGETELLNQLLIHQKNEININDRMINSVDLAPFQALMNANNASKNTQNQSNSMNQGNFYSQHGASYPFHGNSSSVQSGHQKIASYPPKSHNQNLIVNQPGNQMMNFPNVTTAKQTPLTPQQQQQQQVDLNSLYQILASASQNMNQSAMNFPVSQSSFPVRQSMPKNPTSGSITKAVHNSNKTLSQPPTQRTAPQNNRFQFSQSNNLQKNVNKSQFQSSTSLESNKNYFNQNYPNQGSSVLIQQTREPAYHPQVEAISPAPEDVRILDPNESRLLKEREEVTKQMRFLDGEISRHESQLRNLNEREHNLNASLSEKSNIKKIMKHENPPKFSTENPIQAILSETRNQTRNQRMMFSRLCGPNVSCDAFALPIYRQASDLPMIQKIQYDFRQGGFKKKLIKYIRRRKLANKARLELYAKKYSQMTKTYNKKTIKYLSSYSKRQKDAKYRDIFEKMFPEVKKIINERERNINEDGDKEAYSKNEGSDGDQLSSYDPAEEMKKMKEYAVQTPITLPPWERHKEFLWQSGKIEDPFAEHAKAQDLSSWTEEEKNIFKERYIATPKNFGSIASYLEKKTVGECILYYYRTKKKESYKTLVKKNHVRRRRGQCEVKIESPLPKTSVNEDSGSESVDISDGKRKDKKLGPTGRKVGRNARGKDLPTTSQPNPGDKRKRSINSSPDDIAKVPENPLSHKRGPKYGRNKAEEQDCLKSDGVKPEEKTCTNDTVGQDKQNSPEKVENSNTLTSTEDLTKKDNAPVTKLSSSSSSSCVQDLLNLAIERNLITNNNKKTELDQGNQQTHPTDPSTQSTTETEPKTYDHSEISNVVTSAKTNQSAQQSHVQQQQYQMPPKTNNVPTSMSHSQQQQQNMLDLMSQKNLLKSQYNSDQMQKYLSQAGGKTSTSAQQQSQQHLNQHPLQQQGNMENFQIEYLIHQVMSIIQNTPQQNQSKFILDGLMKVLSSAQNLQTSPGNNQLQQQQSKAILQNKLGSHQFSQGQQPIGQIVNPSTSANSASLQNKLHLTQPSQGMKMNSNEDGNRTSVDSLMASVFNSINQKINVNRSETPGQYASGSSSNTSAFVPTQTGQHKSSFLQNQRPINRTSEINNPSDLSSFIHSQQQMNSDQKSSMICPPNQGMSAGSNFSSNAAASFLFENYYASQQLNNNSQNTSSRLENAHNQMPISASNSQLMNHPNEDMKTGFHPFGSSANKSNNNPSSGFHRSSIDPSSLPVVRNPQASRHSSGNPQPPNQIQEQVSAASMFNELVNSAIAMNQGQANAQNTALLSSILAQSQSVKSNKIQSSSSSLTNQNVRSHLQQQQDVQHNFTKSLQNTINLPAVHQQQKQQHQLPTSSNRMSTPSHSKQTQEQMKKSLQFYQEQNLMYQMQKHSNNPSMNSNPNISNQSSSGKLMQNFPMGIMGQEGGDMNSAINAFFNNLQQNQKSGSNFQSEVSQRVSQTQPQQQANPINPSQLNSSSSIQPNSIGPNKSKILSSTPNSGPGKSERAVTQESCYSPLSPSSPRSNQDDSQNSMTGLEARKDTADTLTSAETSRILKSGLFNNPTSKIESINLQDIIKSEVNKESANAKRLEEDKPEIENDEDDNLSTEALDRVSNCSFSDTDDDPNQNCLVIDNTICQPIKKSLDDSSTPAYFAAPNLPTNSEKHQSEDSLYRKRGFTDSQISLRQQVNKILPPGLMEQRQKKLESDQMSIETLSVASPEKHNFATSNIPEITEMSTENSSKLNNLTEKPSVYPVVEDKVTESNPTIPSGVKSLSPSDILDSIIQKNLNADKTEKKSHSNEEKPAEKTEEPGPENPHAPSKRSSPFDSLNERINKVIQDNIHNEEKKLDGDNKLLENAKLDEEKAGNKRIKMKCLNAASNVVDKINAELNDEPDEKRIKKSRDESPYSNPDYSSPLNLKIDLQHNDNKPAK